MTLRAERVVAPMGLNLQPRCAEEKKGKMMPTKTQSRFFGHRLLWAALVCLAVLTSTALAQLPMPVSTQFDINGFLQEATLDGLGTGALQGGHLKANGHLITVPSNTIVILPANALTWQELFAKAPAPYTGVATGMAMADIPAPLSTYEVHVIGNRVNDEYIAGLIFLSQQDLNSGAGFINYIDYSLGEMRVGGIIGDATTGARVRINDPAGRYGRVNTPDARFTVDADNPTIMAGTGFPMCLPRVLADPNVAGNADDPLCPLGNRPKDLTTGSFAGNFTMPDPATLTVVGQLPDPRIQAPFEVGDYVSFAGTLVQDSATPTAGPWPGAASTYISAHTIVNNIAIFTAAGTNPAYVMTDTALMGTGGLTVLGAGEAAIRTRFEGMTTDPSRVIHLYGMDWSSDGKTETDRDWGYIGVDPGPPNGAVKGRWRFRPPCTATISTFDDKKCSPPPLGTFLPPTREVRAVLEANPNTTGQISAWIFGQTTTYANGLIAGQYHAPILEYIFPENIPGSPVAANNFEAIPFLAQGGYSSTTGVIAGQLNPWPGDPATAPAPTGAVAPTVTASASALTVASGGSITLSAIASGTTPITFVWSQTAGLTGGTLTPTTADGSQATYVAPVNNTGTSQSVTFTVTATNSVGSSSATVTITVNPAGNPTVSITSPSGALPLTVTSGTPVTLTASCSDPQNLSCSYVWTQTNAGSAGVPTVLSPNPTTSNPISFTVTLPLGTLTSVTIQLQVVATDTAGLSSAPEFTSVTVNPPVDQIAITSAQYRTSKQRLTINVSDSIVSPNLVLLLQPYVTESGATYNPDPAAGGVGNVFTNNNNGTYLIDLVGAPPPACGNPAGYATPCPATPLTVKSSLGGVSPASALTSIRQ